MYDAATARRLMVEGQVHTADITEPDLLDAMLEVPRERFVPPDRTDLAYLDDDIPISNGRALLKPMVFAKLIQAARPRRGDHILDVGCGTGYSTAILTRLGCSVVALEEDEELARRAKEALSIVGVVQVRVAVGPLVAGWPKGGPYDVIFLNGMTEIAPEMLGRQLKPDGRIACVFGRFPASKGVIFRLIEGRLVWRSIFDAAAPLLPGFAAPAAFVF